MASLKLEGHQVVSELVLGYGHQAIVPFDPLFHILFPYPRQKIHSKRWYCLIRIVTKIYCCLKKWLLLDIWSWLVEVLFDKLTPDVAWESHLLPKAVGEEDGVSFV